MVRTVIAIGAALAVSWLVPGELVAQAPTADSAPPLFDQLGGHQRTITTSSADAQRYFNQGLNWMYAFNHDEAIRSFLHAAELDPLSPMPWWGIAYCEGPNYNDEVMTPERSKAAWYALQNARARSERGSPVERALIKALMARYQYPPPEDRSGLEAAFSEAMAEVWKNFPSDVDVGTLYAESMMVQRPWKLYTRDQQLEPGTSEILATLERVIEMAPQHPGALHLYVHATEPSADPTRGLEAARRLEDLVPASGHLLHMPSHIYVKTGYWADAIAQNEKAMAADTAYLEKSPEQGLQYLYMVHNAHMLAYAAMMSGREKEAMQAARAMWARIPEPALREVGPVFDLWMCSVYDVQKRFGRWDALLEEPAPPEFLPVTTAIWRAHRAIAQAAKKNFAEATREWEAFRLAKAALPEDHMAFADSAHTLLEISDLFIEGEILLQQEKWAEAANLLEKAVEIEDSLTYGEPPQWLQPVRHTLGAVYLRSGEVAEAERVYRDDLERWPNNGWSLFGLSRALEEQGKQAEANEVRKKYGRAWARADAPIETSCKCIPST